MGPLANGTNIYVLYAEDGIKWPTYGYHISK